MAPPVWTLTCTLASDISCVLPVEPKETQLTLSGNLKEMEIPSMQNFLMQMGKKVDKLKVIGVIADSTKSVSQLESDYVDKLASMRGRQVTISISPSRTIYAGNWVMEAFQTTEKMGMCGRYYEYTAEFWKSAVIIPILPVGQR